MEDIFKSVLISAFVIFIIFTSVLGIYMYNRNIKYSIMMLEEENKTISSETEHFFRDISAIVDVMSYSPCLIEANESTEKREIY